MKNSKPYTPTKKRTKRQQAKPGSMERMVSVPRGYKGVAAQIDAIAIQFKHGSSMTRLSRKHSLPLSTIEGVIRMKMLGHANGRDELPPT